MPREEVCKECGEAIAAEGYFVCDCCRANRTKPAHKAQDDRCPTCATEYWSQARHKRGADKQAAWDAQNPGFNEPVKAQEEKCPVCCVPGRMEGETTRHFVSHHFAEMAALKAQLQTANKALEEIAAETIYTYDDGNEGPYIKMRAKMVARKALGKE